ncbi:MFS transporter [Niallia endozanthoxylica]|uniref:MFS transporter n=1 Tax=Niallia endozanthoxylica TaxID=2036016 RepID=A0A5J5HQP9_9BACI|nr:MFS transporter [Niallia endozanthoxylica]KAA9022646.1 MFS transporter [Niallia endozanthoxylica]
MNLIQAGTKEFKRAKLAFLIAGLVTFAAIYTVQPTLPLFSKDFHVSAPAASLTLSFTTGLLSFSMLAAATLSEKIGMKRIMVISMVLTSILGILTSLSNSFMMLLILRALLGIFVAGVPSIAMAFIGKEFSPKDSVMIMGFYISGSSIGGMTGRLFTGLLTDLFSWRLAFAAIGVISLGLSLFFWYTLPASSTPVQRKVEWKSIWPSYKMHLLNKNINYLFILGFLLMGSFVTMYNYIGFSLMQPPFNLSQTIIGLIFIVYLFGTFSSIYMGKKAKQYGTYLVLKMSFMITITGTVITLFPHLIVKIIGISIFTFGFFAAHSIVSALVTEHAKENKAQASSLYLLFYYLGSSFVGTLGGYFWNHFSWIGIIAFLCSLLAAGFILIIKCSTSNTTIHILQKRKVF